MTKIVMFPTKANVVAPHNQGDARCLACANEWLAVVPIGTIWLQCPKCECTKGLLRYACEREGQHWICNCGNRLFNFTPEGVYCPNCGCWQKGF